ncbi:hypothetical protein DH2020_044152 [Rehmannia glutinosa]|uniref:ENTH domain-containing protein n=1 Tax=Rehmannia glutinosa TaxID=99300 RepID=A0ABR0UHQ5_REHGL
MGSLMQDFKRQASFFLREKIKTARLVLTDVTPAQLRLTEEVTKGDSLAPDAHAMRLICRAAFEVDDYERIVHILHQRLSKFETWNWRASYNGLVLLEHLLTHGPQRIAEEFESDEDSIRDMTTFHYVDDKGFNWGLRVKKKSERIMKLLEDRSYLKEERTRARKITVGIKGFGSFSHRPPKDETSKDNIDSDKVTRSNSLLFGDHHHLHHHHTAVDQSNLLASEEYTKLIANNNKAQDHDFNGKVEKLLTEYKRNKEHHATQ